jgi:hypothetical protein
MLVAQGQFRQVEGTSSVRGQAVTDWWRE